MRLIRKFKKEVIAVTKKSRVIALILAAIFFLVIAFSLCVVAVEADHDCHGADCPICELIAVCENNLRGMSLILVFVSLMVALALMRTIIRHTGVFRNKSHTPVSLKVKLTN